MVIYISPQKENVIKKSPQAIKLTISKKKKMLLHYLVLIRKNFVKIQNNILLPGLSKIKMVKKAISVIL